MNGFWFGICCFQGPKRNGSVGYSSSNNHDVFRNVYVRSCKPCVMIKVVVCVVITDEKQTKKRKKGYSISHG